MGTAPAHATLEGLGTVTGTASVGAEGGCTPTGMGLGLPLINPPGNFTWRFITSGLAIAPHAPVVLIVTVDMCGKLTSVAGIGAACGWSKGYDGSGTYTWSAPGLTAGTSNVSTPPGAAVNLEGLGWKLAVGGTWTILGRYNSAATAKTSQFMAVYQAQGGAACFTQSGGTGGANAYSIAGVFALSPVGPLSGWNDVADVVDPKNDGPSSPTNPWGDKV